MPIFLSALPLTLWLNLLAVALALSGVTLYLYARGSQRAKMLERLNAELGRKTGQGADKGKRKARRTWRQRFTVLLHAVGSSVPVFSPAQQREVSQKLVSAGVRNTKAPLIVAALSVLCIVLMVGATVLLLWPKIPDQPFGVKLASCALALYLGMLLPRIVLDRLANRRRQQILISLPDALDMLVICTNAGLSMGLALQRVSSEMAEAAPALSDELNLTASEMQVSSDIAAVLNNLAQRTRLTAIQGMVSTLINATQFGTSVTQALRVLARSERTARMMRLEEQAAKLAVKITLPMMLFIMPTVLIIAAGPAILGLKKTLGAVF
jgi:tight adherence protein C